VRTKVQKWGNSLLADQVKSLGLARGAGGLLGASGG